MSPPAVETVGLTRIFPGRSGPRVALDGLSLTVAPGTVLGLLGPNGAGKTTAVRILTTLLLPTSGVARVLGYDVAREPQRIRPRIGVSFGGERGLYTRVTGRENLVFFANLYRMPPRQVPRRVADVLAWVGLSERADEPVERYSRGMKQRLHLARALLHDPQVVFLDEPSAGLDPWAARDLRLAVRQLKELGKTVILTSHSMPEAEAVADRIVILGDGRILADGTPGELSRLVPEATVVEITAPFLEEGTVRGVRSWPELLHLRLDVREGLHVLTAELAAPPSRARLAPFLARGWKVVERSPTLEDAYLRLTRPEGGDPGHAGNME